jgi:acyl-coenzyme A thioesterase PaaI-like protein
MQALRREYPTHINSVRNALVMSGSPDMSVDVAGRARKALLDSRQANLAFPTVFMDMRGEQTAPQEVTVHFDGDPLFNDGTGMVNWCAFGVLTDITLGSASDMMSGPMVRPATVHVELQMTGLTPKGAMNAVGRFVAFPSVTLARQSIVNATVSSEAGLVAQASAACVLIDLPEERKRKSWPWLMPDHVPALEPADPDPALDRLLQSCDAALAKATPEFPFIDHFWLGIPERDEGTATLRVDANPKFGNRIGHLHGGMQIGIAAELAGAALDDSMRLASLSLYYIRPGVDTGFEVRSQVIHRGRNLATVQTRIVRPDGTVILEALSQHVQR